MEKHTTKQETTILALGAATGWFALILQLYLIIVNNMEVLTMPDIITRYFSFFTIESNIIVAVCLTVLLVGPHSAFGRFFSRNTILTAITVYITIVGLVYNVILRFLWAPTGMDRVADELLHSIMPVFFIIYWFMFVPKENIRWNSFLPWLLFPLLYCTYTLVRGSFAGWYPYPFMNVSTLGMATVLFNSLMVSVAFLFVSLVFIAIAKAGSRKKVG